MYSSLSVIQLTTIKLTELFGEFFSSERIRNNRKNGRKKKKIEEREA